MTSLRIGTAHGAQARDDHRRLDGFLPGTVGGVDAILAGGSKLPRRKIACQALSQQQ